MPLCLLTGLILAVLAANDPVQTAGTPQAMLPKVAEGWSIRLAADLGPGLTPSASALAVRPDGTVYLGVQPPPSYLPGPYHSILAIRGGAASRIAYLRGPIGGLEWADGTLYVLQENRLTARRLDRKDKGDEPAELVRGLGSSATSSSHRPVATGLRLGIDGFLYFAVDDRGIRRAEGKNGRTISLHGGGVVRVGTDGSGLEVVSTGERKPRSVALDAAGEIFTHGEPDPSGRWTGGLTHHIDGGHYGYPYQFLTAPLRALPVIGGGAGGEGGQIVAYHEAGLPSSFRGNLFAADSQTQSVVACELRRSGGTFAVARRRILVEKGGLAEFHPVALGVTAEGDGLWIADAAADARSSRLYRLTYTAPDCPRPAPRPSSDGLEARLKALDHPELSVRMESSRILARAGNRAAEALVLRVHEPAGEPGRIHALWALDAVGTEQARAAIRDRLGDGSPRVRLQAARSCGRRADRAAVDALADLLDDRDVAVRREAAIALGRLGDRAAVARLLDHMGEPDRFAAWSIRTAIRRLGYPDEDSMRAALNDPRRREAAILLADESWSVPVVRALAGAVEIASEPPVRGRMIAILAGQYRTFPEWTGDWWGPNPLANKFPSKTRDWDAGREFVLRALGTGLSDRDPSVRFQAIIALGQVGADAAPYLRNRFAAESDTRNQEALIEALGLLHDPASTGLLTGLVGDAARSEPLRAAALDALASVRSPDVLRARFSLLYDPAAPSSLVARALPPLARAGMIPPNDLAGFLENSSPLVRAAALLSVNVRKDPPEELRRLVLLRLEDHSDDVRQAAVLATGALKLTEAVPRLIPLAMNPGNELRSQAVTALCQMPDTRALAIYKAALQDEDPSLRRAATRALAALPPSTDPNLVPAAVATPRTAPDVLALRQFALSHPGDPRKGEEIFREHSQASCSQCHASDGHRRSSRAPDLATWTRARKKAQIVDALLTPRAPVAAAHGSMGGHEKSLSAIEFTDLITYLQEQSSSTEP
jgi:HEAT repeat protein